MAEPIIELELYLVRHGQSRSNAGELAADDIRAFEDPFLSEKGLEQARLLGEFYAELELDHVLSSGQNRALQTAGEVIKRQKKTHTAEAHPLFTECGLPTAFGEKSLREIQENHPFAVPAAGTDPAGNFVFTEDGTTDAQRLIRARAGIAYLRGRFHNGEKVMVTAHAAINTSLLFAALGLGEEQIFDFAIGNTGVSKLVFYRAGTGLWGADTHLIFHNDRSHLAAAFPADILTVN